MKSIDMTPQKLTYTLLGVLVLILGVIGYFYYQLSGQVSKDISTLQDEAVNREVAETRIDQLKSLKHRLAEIEDISQDINQILPSTKQQAQIIGQLTQVAQEAGFEIDNISFESTGGLPSQLTQTVETGIPGLRVTPVRFAITKKRYSQMLEFLRDIENLQRFTQVESLGITSATTEEDGASQNVLNFNMTLHIFMQTPESHEKQSASTTNGTGQAPEGI